MISLKTTTFPIIHSIYNTVHHLNYLQTYIYSISFENRSFKFLYYIRNLTWKRDLKTNPKTVKKFKYEKISPNKKIQLLLEKTHQKANYNTNDVVNSGSKTQKDHPCQYTKIFLFLLSANPTLHHHSFKFPLGIYQRLK